MPLQENDFIGGLSGITTVEDSSIVVPINLAPLVFEGNKTFRLRLRKNNVSGETISLSPEFTILDYTSLNSITANVNVLDEGDSVQITILTSNVPNGSTVYYSVGAYAGDLDSVDVTPFSGNVVINDNTGTILLTAVADLSSYLDNNESFVVQLRTDSTSGTLVGNSEVISIVDTSNSARLSSLTLARDSALSSGLIYESESFVIELDTINGEGLNSGNLYYSIVGNANIIGNMTGRIPINNNFGNSNVLIFETSVPADETRVSTVRIHVNSTNGAIVGSSSLTALNYTSGIVYPKVSTVTEVYPNVTSVLGAESIGFTVNLVNSYEGETLQYKTTGNGALQTGSFTVSSNTGTIILTADDITEPTDLGVSVYRFNNYNGLLGTSNSLVQITPKDEVLLAIIPPANDNIVEGEGALFQIITRYGIPGTRTLYWDSVSTVTLQQSEGSGNSLSNILVIPETTIDSETTGEISVRIREFSTSGPIIYTSNLITVSNYEGQPNVNFVTPIVTNVTSDLPFSISSLNFTTSTAGGNTLGSLYYSTNNFIGSSLTFNTANTGYLNVNSDSSILNVQHTGKGYFTLQIRRTPDSPLLYESDAIGCFTEQTGGTRFLSGPLVTHVYTSPGSITLTENFTNITLMLVGGGGGGSSATPKINVPGGNGSVGWGGGGGGGGIVKYIGPFNSGTYPIGIGGGGSGGALSPTTAVGTNGGNTTGFGLTALGGGNGGTFGGSKIASTGGSGGGGAITPYPTGDNRNGVGAASIQASQPGNSGTYGYGGGGGGGSAGNFSGGNGGSAPIPAASIVIPNSYGSPSPLGPTYRRFGVGGGGGNNPMGPVGGFPVIAPAATGPANSGNGGQGGGQYSPPGSGSLQAGAAGGSGITIIQYNISENI